VPGDKEKMASISNSAISVPDHDETGFKPWRYVCRNHGWLGCGVGCPCKL